MSVRRTSRYNRRNIVLLVGVVLVAGAWLMATQQGKPDVLAGQAAVIDGDTLRVAGEKVRLQGLAAPELDERGGQAARDALVDIVKGHRVSCELDGTVSHDRVVGICYVAGRDVAERLVRLGLARDCERFSGGRYRALEPASARNLPLPGYCTL
jgi:endonuclease YncB( thermonuclease family)